MVFNITGKSAKAFLLASAITAADCTSLNNTTHTNIDNNLEYKKTLLLENSEKQDLKIIHGIATPFYKSKNTGPGTGTYIKKQHKIYDDIRNKTGIDPIVILFDQSDHQNDPKKKIDGEAFKKAVIENFKNLKNNARVKLYNIEPTLIIATNHQALHGSDQSAMIFMVARRMANLKKAKSYLSINNSEDNYILFQNELSTSEYDKSISKVMKNVELISEDAIEREKLRSLKAKSILNDLSSAP